MYMNTKLGRTTICTMDSKDVEKEFKAELLELYKRYNMYVTIDYRTSIESIDTAYDIDSEGEELLGLDALIHQLGKI